MSKLFKVFLAVMFAASVVWAQIDWTANNITISTADELRELATRTNAGERNGFTGVTFTLADNIDVGGEARPWVPIGLGDTRLAPYLDFNGIFDGNNNTISGIFIYNPTVNGQGLFASFGLQGIIRNLNVVGDVTGRINVGILVGRSNGIIENSTSAGSVKGTGQVGGLVGGQAGNIIANSHSTATVDGSYDAGGLVGINTSNSSIINSSAKGTVTATSDKAGGLVGWNHNNARIENSFSTGDVRGRNSIGGLVGENNDLANIIINSYSTGDVISSGNNIGGLVGRNGTNSRVENSFALSGTADVFIGTNITAANVINSDFRQRNLLRQQSTFTDWDFDDLWEFRAGVNDGFPVHRAPCEFWTADTITIETENDLRKLARMTNRGHRNGFEGVTFVLENDIDVGGEEWTPIGTSDYIDSLGNIRLFNVRSFKGVFDGNSKAVRNVFLNRSSRIMQGLFGINEGIIRNLGVIDVNITALTHSGGLTAFNRGTGTVENVYTTGNLVLIRGCTAGGITGDNLEGGTIRNTYSRVNIRGGNCAKGGLVGGNYGNIINSYAIGNIEGTGSGTLVGMNFGTASPIGTGIINNSFGLNGDTPFIQSRASGDIVNNSKNVSEAELKDSAFLAAAGWCFYTIWKIDPEINDGFPHIHLRTKITPDMIDPIGDQLSVTEGVAIAAPSVVVRDGDKILTEDEHYTVEFSPNLINRGQVVVTVTGIGLYSDTATTIFEIRGGQPRAVIWEEDDSELTFNGEMQLPRVRCANGLYIVIAELTLGDGINVGVHQVRARITNPSSDDIFVNTPPMTFRIAPKTLQVIWLDPRDNEPWTEDRRFTYNKTVQGPITTAKDGDIDIPLHFSGRQTGAGNDLSVLAVPECPIMEKNYTLVPRTQRYTILQRPLNVVISEENENIALIRGTPSATERNLRADVAMDTIEITDPSLFDRDKREELETLIKSLVDFDNFATANGETDTRASIFREQQPTITFKEIEEENNAPSLRSSLNLLRYRIYLLTIDTDSMTAENYRISISDTTFVIRTTEHGNPSFIRISQSRDSRYGVVLENAVVSDLAKISVITPEPAMVNLAILDNLGNVVFTADNVGATVLGRPQQTPIVWNLTNQSGRFVANGTYLIVVEATGINGRRFIYSSRIGVNR